MSKIISNNLQPSVRVLELFSGTGSVGKVCKQLDWEVVSLDIDERADVVCDILKWDYKTYDKDYFDVIWASPPCDNYSILNYSNIIFNGILIIR